VPAVIKSLGCDFGKNRWGSFKGWLGWADSKKMAHPRKLVPGKHKIGSLGFLVAVVEATMNLRGPRIEI
jgi:hypothetical protein